MDSFLSDTSLLLLFRRLSLDSGERTNPKQQLKRREKSFLENLAGSTPAAEARLTPFLPNGEWRRRPPFGKEGRERGVERDSLAPQLPSLPSFPLILLLPVKRKEERELLVLLPGERGGGKEPKLGAGEEQYRVYFYQESPYCSLFLGQRRGDDF